jgi:hypothetical protein
MNPERRCAAIKPFKPCKTFNRFAQFKSLDQTGN